MHLAPSNLAPADLAADDLVPALADALAAGGLDLAAFGRAWARVTPLVVLVPAFGLRALPGVVRATFGLAFAAVLVPAVAAAPFESSAIPALALTVEVVRGLPMAVATSLPLWAMTMAGGVIDQLRGAQESLAVPVVDGRVSQLGALFALAAAALFLAGGGPARAIVALAAPAPESVVAATARTLANGAALAVSVAAPLLVAAVVLEVGAALVARAAAPAHVETVVGPFKSLALLAFVALFFDRLLTLLP